MTDNLPRPDERRLRLNAAADGELDAANLLKLEDEMRADPALAAEYRLIGATREAIRRHAPDRPWTLSDAASVELQRFHEGELILKPASRFHSASRA